MLSAGHAAAGALTCSENVFREKTKKSDARRGNTALCIGFFAGCLLPGPARKLRAAYIAGAANQTRCRVNHIKKSTCFGTSIFGPSDWFRTSGLVVPNGCSNLVLHVHELHLALSAPENLLSGALFSAVSTSSRGGCGQTCGRIEMLPWIAADSPSPGSVCFNALRVCIGRPADS